MTITASFRSRALRALSLRQSGSTFPEIASALGISVNQARHSVWTAQNLGLQATLSRLPHWMNRQFGVEVEHHGVSERTSASALRNAGLQADTPGYTHRVVSEWKCITDASCGYEAVSPILSGEDGFAELKTAMTAIRGAGGSISQQCGMHVHLDMSDLDGPAIARFVRLYADSQAEINRLVPPSRRHNGFCTAWRVAELDHVTESLSLTRAIPAHFMDRYRTINVCSFPRYGTIEVRQHQGTLNGAKAEAWIKLMMALVEVAKTGRQGEVVIGAGTEAWLDSVSAIVGMPAGIKARLVRRLGTLAGAR